jgi:hypothetical protein
LLSREENSVYELCVFGEVFYFENICPTRVHIADAYDVKVYGKIRMAKRALEDWEQTFVVVVHRDGFHEFVVDYFPRYISVSCADEERHGRRRGSWGGRL